MGMENAFRHARLEAACVALRCNKCLIFSHAQRPGLLCVDAELL